MRQEEADRICQAQRYERKADRQDTGAGHYRRKLQVKAGDVELRVSKLRTLPFETETIERYRRRESSVEEALTEMYLAGVNVRWQADLPEVVWGTRCYLTVERLTESHREFCDMRRQRAGGQRDGLARPRPFGLRPAQVPRLARGLPMTQSARDS